MTLSNLLFMFLECLVYKKWAIWWGFLNWLILHNVGSEYFRIKFKGISFSEQVTFCWLSRSETWRFQENIKSKDSNFEYRFMLQHHKTLNFQVEFFEYWPKLPTYTESLIWSNDKVSTYKLNTAEMKTLARLANH